jgi:hypothetical protein
MQEWLKSSYILLMYKIVLLFFCALFLLLDVEPVQAREVDDAAVEAESSAYPKVPRPNYKRYRGNSRSKSKRLGLFRRRAARRKAKRKQTAKPAPRRGVISVDEPKGTMPKNQ